MNRRILSLACFALLAPFSHATFQDDAETKEEEGLTLERLFDKDGFFGPGARSVAISADGKYAAYLWRPYVERRHGSDLWLLDLASDEATRVTSVSVMAPFQKSTRKVGEDRLEKAKKAGKKDEGKGSWDDLKKATNEKPEDETKKDDDVDENELMDTVGEDDADDDKAPRYRGISSFTWAPETSELLFTSGGDIYRYAVGGEDGIVRLTKTRESEREVQYAPDGQGYTTLAGDALVSVRFGDHFVEQLDPRLPDGMTMREYELSPDGKRLVFVASNGSRFGSGGRTVDIATYRDRFMKVRTVPRTVSDDPIGNRRTAVFLYERSDPSHENGRLIKVYERETTGPRDVLQLPDWAPDSSGVTFAVFDQATEQVQVLESKFPDADDEPQKKDEDDDHETIDARVVKRFLHTGGPNTPRMIQPKYLADSRRIALLTEQTGFRHLHVLDPVYETLEPITRGHFEVYPREMSDDRTRMFVEATKEDPACLDIYEVELATGEMKRLTDGRGRHSGAAVSDDGKHVLSSFSGYGRLSELVHRHVTDGKSVAITDSHPDKADDITSATPTFFEYPNRNGQTIHGLLFEPERASKDEKRPLLIYVYGGPLGTRKQVYDGNYSGSAYLFARYMTEVHGWVTCTIDPRGMSGYGALFEKANFEQVGKPQVEDLVDGVKFLVENHGVDGDRVAMHGWSFGGFQTQMCLYTEPEVFRCGIAGAGPTEWENYNSWYSTGTIGNSREGKTDLDKYSLLPLAKNLERKLLLVHGMEDANVLYQDTVRVYAELLEAGKETLVELFVDPTGGHGLGGHVKSLNRYRKYEEFLLRTNVAPPKSDESATKE